MRANKISLMLISGEFFSMDAMNNLLMKKYESGLIINYSIRKCWVKGWGRAGPVKKEVQFFYSKNERINYLFSPLFMPLNVLIIFFLAFKYALKFAPKKIVADSYILPILLGILKPMGFTGKTVYIAGDWHEANKNKKRLISYFGNVLVFPVMDYLACKFSDVVLNYSDKIKLARYSYWGKFIPRSEKTITFPFIFKAPIDKGIKGQSLCYLGLLKPDSGLDIAISSLKGLRKHGDFNIVVIGPHSHSFSEFKKLAEREGVESFVKFMGFVERDNFQKIISRCFCGISMVKDKDSYTSFTFQGKIGDYLQYLLPVVASRNVGLLKDVIEKNNLGVVTDTDNGGFMQAVLKVYGNQQEYRRNIVDYIRSNQDLDIESTLGLD